MKTYLEGIAADEGQIRDFYEAYDGMIGNYVRFLWKEWSARPAEMAAETPVEMAAKSPVETPDSQRSPESVKVETPVETPQPPTDMPKFDSGETRDKAKAENEALAFQIKNKQITFLNGKVNQPYAVDFDYRTLGIPEVSEVSFEGLEAIGLRYDPESNRIEGLPTRAGDHKITLKCKLRGYEERKPLEREVILIINPDPRELWSKNFPTREDSEYYKPDSDKSFPEIEVKKKRKLLKTTEIACKRMVAASQRGRSHAIDGKPRDDDFALYFDEQSEFYVMIVADGAGSAKYSRWGSKLACETAKQVCVDQLEKNREAILKNKTEKGREEIEKIVGNIIQSAVYNAYKAIWDEAQAKPAVVKDYATTLILSLCKKFDYGWLVGSWWVGDGGIGIYGRESRSLKVLGEPDGGEFAGQTRFLTMRNIIEEELGKRVCMEVVDDFTALVLMSDGVTDPKFETDANLNRIEKWDELWDDLGGANEEGARVEFSADNPQVAEQLLAWLDFWSKGNHDDRTIAILF